MPGLVSDLAHALRSLLARPGFAALAVVTLALGIGANTAIYSLLQQMLLQPLPVTQPGRLLNVASPGPRQGWTTTNNAGDDDQVFSYPLFRDLQREFAPVLQLAAHRSGPANLAFAGQSRSGTLALVSGSYFPVLGVRPALGRLLQPEDDARPGDGRTVVLGHRYWRDELGARNDVLGATLVVNGLPLEVVGVAPENFAGTTLGVHPQVYLPLSVRFPAGRGLPNHDDRLTHWLYLFGRLGEGVGLDQALAVAEPRFRHLMQDVEAPLQDMSERTLAEFRSRPLLFTAGARGQSTAPDQAGMPLRVLFVVTLMVLLIACVNIANLMLARGAARGGEMAIRRAIGASRWRLLRQGLCESLLIAGAGVLAALPLAVATLRGLAALLPDGDGETVALLPEAVLFAAVAGLGTALLFGLYPSWQAARSAPQAALQGQAARSTGGAAAQRFRSALATLQIALSMTLLVLAGLFAQSLANASRVDLGLRTEQLVAFSVAPERNGYRPEASAQLFQRIEEALRALPGVTATTSSLLRLLSGNDMGNNVSVEGFEAAADTNMDVRRNEVGPGFFRTLGVPLLAGREFTAADALQAPKVAIVNRAFAERFDLGAEPVGKRIAIGAGGALDIEIVGLIPDIAYSNVKDTPPAQVILPVRQNASAGSINVYLRSALPSEQLFAQIRETVRGIDPHLPVDDLRTMEAQIANNLGSDRVVGILSALFAGLATVLAAVGLFGLLSYTVAQRTREIGLRLALGASPRRLVGMLFGQIGRMTGIGLGLGLALSLGLAHAARSLLFGIGPFEPGILIGSACLLLAVAVLAGVAPARRALRINPIQALRQD
jgi:putative ABC transport system permease protein